MENDTKKTCPYGDDIVSYMYEEMPVTERSAFEGHLVACQVCTDDFAAVSLSRFEAYDWKRLEFDPLATPRIAIPYQAKTISFGERLSAWMSWATLVPVAAALVIGLSIVYLLISNSGKSEPMVAANEELTVPASSESTPAQRQPTVTRSVEIGTKTPASPSKVQLASTSHKSALPKTQLAQRVGRAPKLGNDLAENIPDMKHAPRLGIRDEEDDRSLRLSDLFDESNPPPQR